MTETMELAESFLPRFEDGKKATYMAYKIANFSTREACELTPVSERMVRKWRADDPGFAYVDGAGLTEIRKQFAGEYLDMQFARNFHLVLQKDFKILYKSMVDESSLTDREFAYLIKVRSHYTPQALAMIKQILGGGTVEEPFDFTKLTLSIRRETQQMDVRIEQ